MAVSKQTDILTPSTTRDKLNSVIDQSNKSLKSATISGNTITVKKNDDTTSTITLPSVLGTNISVSASTQSSLSPNHGGDKAYDYATIPNTTTGIGAGTFTLQNLLQQLVYKSHTHANVTFNCNCYGDYCSSSSCIIKGNILTNTGYKNISELKKGDIVLDNNLIEHEVVEIITGVLEKRNAISIGNTFPIFTDDHVFLINDKEYGSCKIKNNYKEEKSYIIGTNKNIYDIKNTKSNFTIIKNNKKDFVLENINIIENQSYNTKTYMPVIEGSEWCIIDDFVVQCAIANND